MAVNDSVTQNLLPVQAYFDLQGNFQTFIGQGKPFYATTNPIQSGLTITNSTIDSSVIGGTTPAAGYFTNITANTGQVITTPTGATDIANKGYVDAVASGLSFKAPALVTTTGNITLSGLQTIDGVSVSSGDRVLVRNQSNAAQNGIYVASSGSWSYASDANVYADYPSAFLFVEEGTTWAGSAWVCTSQPGGTLGTTPITFTQFSNNATYSAGTGLTLTGYQFSITNTSVTAGSYGSASNTLLATVNAQGQLTSLSATPIAIANTQVSGLGTMSTQNANSVAITGGSINGTTIGGSSAAAITGTTVTATSSFSGPGTGLTGTATGLSIGGNAATATYATTAGSAGSATTATNLAGGAAYSLPYQTAANTTTFLATGTGVLQDNGTLAWTTSPSLVGTNFSSIPNSALTNSSITIGSTSISLGATASSITAVSLANPTVSNYENFTASSAPSYSAGRMWYDSTVNSFAYYNDVTNNTLHIGEEIQLKVYNNTGSTINIGQPVYVTSTSSGYTYPNVALAIANSLTTGNVIGLANQNIPTGTAGYVTTIGLVQGLNTGSYTVGDTLYLSPYSAGFYQNTIPPTGYAIKLGTVAYVNSSTGSIYVNKSILSVQAGNIVGQVALANGGTNANLTAVAGGVVYSGASALAISAAGTSGQFLQSNGTGAPTWATPVSYATVTDDTTTNGTRYPLFANQTSGSLSTEYTSSTKLQFNPSTGVFTATSFSGAGTGLTGTASSLSIGGNAATATSATSATTSTNLAGGLAGYLPYQSAVNTTTFLAPGTNGYILTLSSGLPTWAAAPATGVTITDDTSSATAYYPLFARVTSGTATTEYTSSTKLNYTPSTGLLSATAMTSGSYIATETITGSLSAGAFSYGTLGYTDTSIFASFTSSTNSYNQIVLQNTNSGTSASCDFVVSNNNGTASAYYGDFGMNSSGFTGTGSMNLANAVYLQSSSSDLVLGTLNASPVHFVYNNGATDAITISTGNSVAFNGSYGTSGQILQSNGTGSAPTWTTFSGGATVTSTTSTGPYYIVGSSATSGSLSTAYVNTGISYNASTGDTTTPQVVASNGIFVNNLTVGATYSIPSGYSAHSVGPVTVASGKSVTVPSGSRWVIL